MRCATLFQALLTGSTQVVEKRMSVSNFWPALVASGATVTYVLGAMVPMLMSRPPSEDERRHKVRCALAPGVPLPMQEPFTERTGIVLLDGYGATESNAVIGTHMGNRRTGWIGQVVDGFQARVVDEEDNEVPRRHAGRIAAACRRAVRDGVGLFRHGRQDRRGLAQSVAAHRRPRGAQRGRLLSDSSTA